MIKRIYILRHAQTFVNKEKVLQGQSYDSKLSIEGIRQADLFFEKNKHLLIDKIYLSSLQRSYDSVENFITRKNVPHEKIANLNEVNWGILEGKQLIGKAHDQYTNIIKKWQGGNFQEKIKDGENLFQVIIRAKKALNYIMSRTNEINTLIVTHSRILKIILCLLLYLDLKKQDTFIHKNMCFYKLKYICNNSKGLLPSKAISYQHRTFPIIKPFAIIKNEFGNI